MKVGGCRPRERAIVRAREQQVGEGGGESTYTPMCLWVLIPIVAAQLSVGSGPVRSYTYSAQSHTCTKLQCVGFV